MSHAVFGYPHGDALNSYIDREAREERYQAARERRERFGEAKVSRPRGGIGLLTLPTEDELSRGDDGGGNGNGRSWMPLDLPTVEELERAAKEVARVGEFHGWLAEKAKELGLDRR